MYYRHNLDYKYPERSDEHMISVRHVRDVNFDENYPYFQKSFGFKCKRVLLFVLLNGVLSWLLPITHGLRIHGRKKLRENKELFKDGLITVSNHVYMWDFISVMLAMRPRLGYFPAWGPNMEGPNGPWIRMSGGIPIPTDSMKSMKKFKQAMEEAFETTKWMHFYPEGSLWFYYPDIRPLKKSAFQYAVKYNRPVVPITMSFRPCKGIRKIFRKQPLVDLHIGDPLLPNQELSPAKATLELQQKTYHMMQVMNGIHPGDPTYNTDLEIENYKCTMR